VLSQKQIGTIAAALVIPILGALHLVLMKCLDEVINGHENHRDKIMYKGNPNHVPTLAFSRVLPGNDGFDGVYIFQCFVGIICYTVPFSQIQTFRP